MFHRGGDLAVLAAAAARIGIFRYVYTGLPPLEKNSKFTQAYWETVQAVRNAVNKEIENQRNAGKLGSALEADVVLYCDDKLKQELDKLQNELRFVLITSGAEVRLYDATLADLMATDVKGLWLQVKPLTYAKCERCWHRRKDVGTHANHPALCDRCIENVEGAGEKRAYA
jgi:isoleucyl-tRNA synthetase